MGERKDEEEKDWRGGEDEKEKEKERRRGVNERYVIEFLIVSLRNYRNHRIGLC